MELNLKWVHMARYELVLKLDGALWLTIISGPLLTPKRGLPGWRRPCLQKCAQAGFPSYIYIYICLLSQPPDFQTASIDFQSE